MVYGLYLIPINILARTNDSISRFTGTYKLAIDGKPIKKKTMALAWIYLKTFGQMTLPLCNEVFWDFKKEDFKHALACFIFEDGNDDENDEETKILVENIKMRFNKFLQAEYKGTITDWTKEMYSLVSLSLEFEGGVGYYSYHMNYFRIQL